MVGEGESPVPKMYVCTYTVAKTCLQSGQKKLTSANFRGHYYCATPNDRVVSRFTPNCRSPVSQKSSSCTVLNSQGERRKLNCASPLPTPFLFLSPRRKAASLLLAFHDENRLFSLFPIPRGDPRPRAEQCARSRARDSPNRSSNAT